MSTADAQNLNSENMNRVIQSFGAGHIVEIVVIFPELRDMIGFFVNLDNNDNTNASNTLWDGVDTSTNTTSGTDGTWTNWAALSSNYTFRGAKPTTRTNIITPGTVTGIKGIRFGVQYNNDTEWVNSFHLYGYPSTGQNPDSLRPWDPVLNQQADGTTLDFGDIARGTNATLTFRIKNVSSTLTANSIGLTMEALTDSTPSLIGQFFAEVGNPSGFTKLKPHRFSDSLR